MSSVKPSVSIYPFRAKYTYLKLISKQRARAGPQFLKEMCNHVKAINLRLRVCTNKTCALNITIKLHDYVFKKVQ